MEDEFWRIDVNAFSIHCLKLLFVKLLDVNCVEFYLGLIPWKSLFFKVEKVSYMVNK